MQEVKVLYIPSYAGSHGFEGFSSLLPCVYELLGEFFELLKN